MGAKSACSVFARPAGAAPRSTNATWRLQNSRKSALFSWSNHKISPAALCNDRNGHITAENRECFYFGGPGARGPRTCGWEHTFREINLAPPSHTTDTQVEPVGRARGATDGGLVQHDGLARPRAARPTGRRLRLRRARPSAIQRSCVTYSHNEPPAPTCAHACALATRLYNGKTDTR